MLFVFIIIVAVNSGILLLSVGLILCWSCISYAVRGSLLSTLWTADLDMPNWRLRRVNEVFELHSHKVRILSTLSSDSQSLPSNFFSDMLIVFLNTRSQWWVVVSLDRLQPYLPRNFLSTILIDPVYRNQIHTKLVASSSHCINWMEWWISWVIVGE